MDDLKCKNCTHFRQHYVYWYRSTYRKIPCGHCVHPHLKHRTPDTLACVYYTPKPPEEQEESNN